MKVKVSSTPMTLKILGVKGTEVTLELNTTEGGTQFSKPVSLEVGGRIEFVVTNELNGSRWNMFKAIMLGAPINQS